MSNGILDKLSSGITLFNVAMPGIISLVATFADGREVDIKKLLDDTDARVKKIIDEGESFLDQPDPEATPETPPPPAAPEEPPA